MRKKQTTAAPAPTSVSGPLGTAGQIGYEKGGFCPYCLMSIEAKQPGGADPRHVGTLVPYGECVQGKQAKEQQAARVSSAGATCTKCGCTDSKACEGGCWWVKVDREAGTGLCSNCS
jgi:hypothetical protein